VLGQGNHFVAGGFDGSRFVFLMLETVSRVLSRFSHDGLIEVNQKHVRIFDAEGLRAIVSGVPLSEQR
jgi:CRP/FNR family transcriptional regulator